MTQTSPLGKYLIDLEIRWHHSRQMNAIYRSLKLVFPVILLGSLADFFDSAWLQKTGYYYQTLGVGHWDWPLKVLRAYFRLVSAGTLGFAAILLAFAVSFYLVAAVTPHTTDRLIAGMTAVISLKFFNVNRSSVLTLKPVQWLSTNLGIQGVCIGILMGLLVGNGYRWWLQRQSTAEENLPRPLSITSGWLLFMAALGLLWISTQTVGLNVAFASIVRWPFKLPHFILGLLGFSTLSSLFQWLGALGPLTAGSGQTIETAQNLAAVLNHSGWQLPHPVTLHTIVSVYTTMGGTGMAMALLLAIFLSKPDPLQRRVGWLSALPTLGNLNTPLLVGLPVMFSPILAVPFLLAPLACTLISWACVRLQLVPAVAYPLANGTPGPLIAYLGTGGSWTALILAVINLVISTAIYYPFVKWFQLAQRGE